MAVLTMAKAVNSGLAQAMADDAKVLLMGEDIGRLGGVFRVTDGLQERFGEDRVIDTPLAERGIIGTAVGLAMRGYAPVAEIQFDGFIFPAFDQITTQVARLHLRSAGKLSMRIVIRVPNGGGIGAVGGGTDFVLAQTRLCRNTPTNLSGGYTDLGGNLLSEDCNGNGNGGNRNDRNDYRAERHDQGDSDQPYAGGFITQQYGRPEHNQHVLQIEINRALYMDEISYEKTDNFSNLQTLIDALLGSLAEHMTNNEFPVSRNAKAAE